jgi:hypothetical protein
MNNLSFLGVRHVKNEKSVEINSLGEVDEFVPWHFLFPNVAGAEFIGDILKVALEELFFEEAEDAEHELVQEEQALVHKLVDDRWLSTRDCTMRVESTTHANMLR